MSDSKFDGIEDLTEVKYDPADPYKHRRKKIPCKFCPKSISSRNMSTHVKTVHADVDDNQIHSIKNSTRCSKKLVCIKSEENAKELKIDLKEHIFGVHRILSNAKQRQNSKIPKTKKVDHNNNCVCKKCLKGRIDPHPEEGAVPKEENTETVDKDDAQETEIVEKRFLCLKCNFKTNLEGDMIEHYEEVH